MTANGQYPGVDIIIPVYRNLPLTRRCINSVLANTDCGMMDDDPARVIVVDDATPEPELVEYCDSLADQGNIILLRNADNRGFVASVNRGMTESDNRDVVLLNSDTEVPPGWLARLQACAWQSDDIATVTPFSNNGSICSYPYFCEAAELPSGLDLASLDKLFAEANSGIVVDIPTAVGFCMYIRRECLNRYGLFDEEEYGRGYGEENDFSLRVGADGWRNCLCADLLVYHRGGASFGNESQALMEAAEKKLSARYAGYSAAVMEFIARDPLQPYRDKVSRLRLSMPGQSEVVMAEWQHEREGLNNRLAELHKNLHEYERLLGEAREANRQAAKQQAAITAEYDRLLTEAREAFSETDAALATTARQLEEANHELEEQQQLLAQRDQQLSECQVQLDSTRNELERLNNKRIIRLGRWIKRNLFRQ